MKKYVVAIQLALGITAFSKNESGVFALTDEQQTALKGAGWNESFIAKFNTALGLDFAAEADNTDAPEPNEPTVDAQALIDTTIALSNAEEALAAANQNASTLASDKANLQATVNDLQAKVTTLSNLPEQDHGAGAQNAQAVNTTNTFNAMDDKQLGGLQGEMFALEGRPYNQRARAALLAKQGISVMVPMAADASVDFAAREADLGAYYRQNRSQQLASFVAQMESVESIFPLESGIQDREVITNMFMGEFSQADSSNDSEFDQVVKGKYEIQPEEIRMYDVMFANNFKGLKKLEKQWIAYLNREGSSSIKISFIEYLLQETSKVLHNEREQRRMKGVRKNPTANVPGKALEASTGFFRYIAEKVNGLVIKPFALGEVTLANIGEKIYEGTKLIPQEILDSGKVVLFMPNGMVSEYHKYNETHYGLNQDYKPDSMFVKEFPDVRIQPLKNCGNHRRLVWSLDGNFKTFENVPGEMTNYKLIIKEFGVSVISQWKEGLGAILTGKKWERAQDMDYNHQFIFCSDTDLASDTYLEMDSDTTTPSALFHSSLVSVANTSLKTITNILDVAVGAQVKLKNGSDAYGIKIVATGNFSLLGSDWEPGVGDSITLVKRADGKFIELSRSTTTTSILAFAADDATPSVAGGNEFITDANAHATAITTLDDAVIGKTYTIHGAGSTYASTIANSGNFTLTAAMTLSNGTSITLICTAANKFAEISRA